LTIRRAAKDSPDLDIEPAMSTPATTFPNFKEAYCAAHGCSPEKFTGHLLCRSVPTFLRPLAAATYRLNPSLFLAEIDVINQMGRSSSGREIGSAISELDGLRRVERSFWRSVGLRANGDRLLDAWAEVKSLIAKPTAASPVPATTILAPSTPVTEGQRDRPAVLQRRLRQLHTDVTSGKDLAAVLAEANMTESELMDLLEANAASNAQIAWLHRHLAAIRRVAELEAENRGLAKMLSQAGLQSGAATTDGNPATAPRR
jgi:hypothetical protein